MKKIFAFILLLIFLSCEKIESPQEKRYIEKVVIQEGHVEGFDVLSGPDLKIAFTSRGERKESELFEDVIFLPVTFEEVAFEISDSLFRLQVYDEDEWDPDDILFDRTFRPYKKTEEGNPFQLIYPDWVIDIYWKPQG